MNYGTIHIPDAARRNWATGLLVTTLVGAKAPEYLLEYDPEHDYCGPEGALAGLVPNEISGVCINFAAFWHDRLYWAGGTEQDRRAADWLFFKIILVILFKSKLCKPGGSFVWAACKAVFYYGAVHFAGGKFFKEITEEEK